MGNEGRRIPQAVPGRASVVPAARPRTKEQSVKWPCSFPQVPQPANPLGTALVIIGPTTQEAQSVALGFPSPS